MPKVKISEYSATAADNTDINGIDIAEGCAPSGINDAIRTLMKQIKDLQAGTSGDTIPLTAGGTGATTASAARTALGVSLGVDVQAFDANLTTFVSVFTLPTADGTANQVLKTDGSGVIGFAAAATGDVTTTGTQTLTNKTLTGVKVTVSALGTLTTGTTTIDLATAQVYTATITAANTITLAFSNDPGAGSSQVVLFRLIDAGGGTIVYPANTKFTAGTAPVFTASGVDVIGIYYDVTTTTYMVFVIGLDVKVP
jgi:hypothetical protein